MRSPKVAATARAYRQAQVASPGPRRTSTPGRFAAVGGAAGLGVLAYWLVSSDISRCEATGTCVEAPGRVALAAEMPASMTCPEGMVLVRDTGLDALCLDRSEVTRAAFCRYAPDAPQCIDPELRGLPPTSPITRVHPQEAAAHCGARGLRLPTRDEFVPILHRELGGRSLDHVLAATNVCGEECVAEPERDPLDFVHVDRHKRMAPVGSYRLAFASPSGLDDIFGNVREIVRDGDLYFACGSSWRSSQLVDLDPGQCLSALNRSLVAASNVETVGFRCAGEPPSGRPEGSEAALGD